ncbi:phoenix [Scomber scombrus]|uniref:Phoenix n=1 Tax=Scomber scombrus TaxID=13677 RepID=A0AAV1PQY1_SCOSC
MMNQVHHRKHWSRSAAQISAALSADSCHLVLETAPPDYVEKISRYLESSVGHSKCDPESTDSDSGNSLFITQKDVPEAVRSQRRRHSTQRSEDPTSHTELEDSEDSSSASCREDGKKRRRKKQKLPIYSFPFLTERKGKDRSAELSVQDNIKIHYAGMGGFFHSVKELWQSYQEGNNLESSLPTVDVDGEEITPLSEEEERSDDEDIKVVERNRFVVSCKARRRQIWNAPQKGDEQVEQQKKRRTAGNATQETSQGRQRMESSSSDLESTDDGESSRRVRAEKRRSNKHLKSRRNIAYQTPSSSSNSQKVMEDELHDDSDATNSVKHTQQGRDVSSTTVPADVCHTLNLSETEQPEDEPGTGESQDLLQPPPHLIRDSNGDESSIKKRKKKKAKHRDEDEATEAQQAVTSEDVEIADAESPAPQAADEPELNENNQTENSLRDNGDTLREEDGNVERELPHLKQKKKKRKKNKLAVENNEQEDEVGHLECDVRVEEKKKKKKRDRNGEREEDVEQLSSSAVAEPLNDAEIPKKKKKRKKEKSLVNTGVSNSTLDQVEEHESCLESNAASQETLESSYVKKKKPKKKKQSYLDATEAGEEDDGGDVSTSNDPATPAGKKKKKKKKRKGSDEREEDAEQLSSSAVAEPLNDAEIPKKKKKRKKEKSLVNTEEVLNSTVDQVEEPESCLESNAASQETLESSFVKKKKHKKKKQSCLDATEAGEEEVGGDVNMSNDAATPAGKKKKKKISICDETDVSPEETTGDKEAELVSKKKKKKKKERTGEILSRNMSEDTEAQSHDSVSVREKEKKKASSFLAADAEGNCAQTHQDKSSPSQSVAVSAGDFEAESAETAGNVSVTESNGEVQKKKKKKKAPSDKDSKRYFEEPNETRQSDLHETTDVAVKKKKKRRREESESATPAESAADAGCLEIDEAVVVKKKRKTLYNPSEDFLT